MVLTDLSRLLHVESIGDEGEVGVNKSQCTRHISLNVVSWVEDQLHPAIIHLVQNRAPLCQIGHHRADPHQTFLAGVSK